MLGLEVASLGLIMVLLQRCAAFLVGFIHLVFTLTNCNIVTFTYNIKTVVVFQIVYYF